MKTYTYSQARQRLAEVLDNARKGKVAIRRRNGDCFVVSLSRPRKSPFEVRPIATSATTRDIVDAIRESRARYGRER